VCGSRVPGADATQRCVLRIQMRQSFLHSDLIYVARREWHDMLEQAQALRMHRIVRLMRKKALHVRP
jgi:putative transposase